MKPFQPPSTKDQVEDSLRNLHAHLSRFGTIDQHGDPATATLEEVAKKQNLLIALLSNVTKGGEVRRK